MIYRLGDVVESRSNEAGNHVRRMSEVCHMLGLAIGMSQEEAELLRQAAPMHDVGKISTPDAVLLKPGKLTDEEMLIMKDHPSIGYSILKGSKRPILQAAAVIAKQHHDQAIKAIAPLADSQHKRALLDFCTICLQRGS